jgi:ATP-dependent RNA helicase RhlB
LKQFSEFSLSPNLLRSINEAGFIECTDVQIETLSHTLSGKDVFVQSQTGTGKTAAFLISIFELMERSNEREKALIIVPTRELALQIEAEAKLLTVHQSISTLSIYGGVGYSHQEKNLSAGVDIVIGTPGRLIDLSNKGSLNLHQFNYAVIDEADRLFDMGFFGDIRKILGRMPKKNIRQTMLFSATLSFSVKQLSSGYMNHPEEITIETETITVHTINQKLFHVGSSEKFQLLIGVLRNYSSDRTLIFTNTKNMCEEIAGRLELNGFYTRYLTGDLPQRKRMNIVNRFKENRLPILVATDIAARGLHVDDLELVVNYDIPQYCENYVHRIGRTARAGKSGTAITLACEKMIEYLEPIEKFIGMKIPSSVADEELYAEDKSVGKNYRSRKSIRQYKKNSEQDKKQLYQKKSRQFRKNKIRDRSDKIRKKYKKEKMKTPSQLEQNDLQPVKTDSTPAKRHKHKNKKGLFSRVFSIFKR